MRQQRLLQRQHGSVKEGRSNPLKLSMMGRRRLHKGEIRLVLVCECDRVSLVLIRDPIFPSCILFHVVQLISSRITRPGTKSQGSAKSVSLERLLTSKTEWPVKTHSLTFIRSSRNEDSDCNSSEDSCPARCTSRVSLSLLQDNSSDHPL
jgi:hypothetical protein